MLWSSSPLETGAGSGSGAGERLRSRFHGCRAAGRTSWLPPGSLPNALSMPRATTLTDRMEEAAAPRDLLTGMPLVYTKEGHAEAPEENTPVSSSGLWLGALCWELGFVYGEHHEAGAEMLRLFPAHIFRALPQDITQDEGCAPASKRQSRGPARLEPALGNSAATGSCLAPAVLPVTLCLTSTMEGSPREGWCRAVATAQLQFWPRLCPLTCCLCSKRSSTNLAGTQGHQ